jgi:predicted rRNA methylase YqxC with S4 and FtsJ domains
MCAMLSRYREKTDQLDSQWVAKFLVTKLLKVSFIPIRKILHDIIRSDYDPDKLLYHVHGNVKKNREEIEEVITGYVTDHH